ncbi:MAG: FAD-dependent oxidoreductase [Bacillota bacterium]|nr:FAD-dependent oxidoreductase [Bacillota bacterium]HHU29457.1 FAD-dependent oxidoreductase [Bacillota bacterium]
MIKLEDATAYTERCIHGEPASCSYACPFHLDARSFMERAAAGKWARAYKQLREATIFPFIVSVLCDQPCRKRCQRTLLGDEAIAMRDVEAACVRYVKNRKPQSYAIPPKQECIAVVGAGVAGLSCALNLAQKKFNVTVFEKADTWGGALRDHAWFAEFAEEFELQFSAVKVDFRYNTGITSLEELAEYDAVYVATGEGGESFGLLESWNPELFTTAENKVFLGGMLTGATLMESIAQGILVSKIIEGYLQTGRAALTPDMQYDKNYCGRYLDHEDAVSVPLVVASSLDGYTEEEAKQEAARCLLCDCDKCMAACEMLKRFKKTPKMIAVEVFADTQVNPPYSTRSLTRQAYSCNICGYCKSICPEDVDIGSLLQLSRRVRMNAGVHPAALHDFWLREMDFATAGGSYTAAPRGKNNCEYAFFPGCQLGAAKPEYVLKAYAYLDEKYDCGIMLTCCGAPAYWAGDDKRVEDNLQKIRESWEKLGKPVLVFACATCESLFKQFLPEIERISLYELLVRDDSIVPTRPFAAAAVFDPCNARGEEGMQQGVRKLAEKAGIAVEELKEKNRCCGYGGHIRVANPSLYDEIAHNRVRASEKPYVVYCVNCREVFSLKDKEAVHVLDMVFGTGSSDRLPTLQEKRENSLEVKKKLMSGIEGTEFTPEKHDWDDLVLLIDEETQKEMEQKLISAGDLKEAIWLAETTGKKFFDESDGMCLASMVKPVITYWVQYKEAGPKTYQIHNAYYHRIRIREEE